MPLDEEAHTPSHILAVLKNSTIILGESKKKTYQCVRLVPNFREKQIFLLDNPDRDEIFRALRALQGTQAEVSLFSDSGMPILFDPGKEILHFFRKKGWNVRSISGPTSWGAAAALSGYSPPFLLLGFLSQKIPAAIKELNLSLKICDSIGASLIILEAPYRFHHLFSLLKKGLQDRELFLAWELDTIKERLVWGTPNEILSLDWPKKGEFVIVISAKR